MASIFEYLDEAFDLNYLNSSEFPKTNFNSMGILGGGTAGYFTALALNKCHPSLKVSILEASKIPVIGVGESTTTEVLPFLHHLLEFDPIEFFQEVEPTLKLGIQFDWGQPNNEAFNFNFFASHHHESYYYENNIVNSNWPSVLMKAGKVPVVKNGSEQIISLLSKIPFAYHIDNKKFVAYLRKKVLSRGIEIIDTEISHAQLDDKGFIKNIVSSDESQYSFDVFIDCSGFRSKLIGEALNTPYQSFKETLVTDRALTFNLPHNNKIDPFTSAITMNNGWCWKIPMRNEDHYGYVYSSEFCTKQEALEEVNKRFGSIGEYKIIPFKSGRHEKAWNKNVFAIGNSYAFIEPLESTAIQTIIHSIMLLCRLMPNSFKDTSSITGLNKEIAANWDTFRWFLGVHYKFNNKLSTKFWNWTRENVQIGDAQDVINLFQAKAPLSKGHYGTTTGYTAHEPLVFNGYSYDTLLFGQDLVNKKLPSPEMSKEDYFKKCTSYKELTNVSLTQDELLKNTDLLYGNLLPELFNDYESWIASTYV